MFWGLIMEPGKKYSQTVQKPFHISQAALDIENATNDPVQVLLGFDNRNYLMCTLQKGKWIQTPLDLNFQAGDKVSFATNGPGHVHLTGYLVPEDEFDLDEQEDEDLELEEEIPELVPAKKRKAIENNVENAAKKSKTAQLLEEVGDSDDSDDSDVNLSAMLEEEDGEEEDDSEEHDGLEEESVDDEEDDDDEDDDDEDESNEEEAKVEIKMSPKKDKTKTPIKENGVAKKPEKTPKLTPGKEKQTPGKDKPVKTPQQNEKKPEQKTPKGQKTPGKESPQKKTVEGGVVVEDIKVGDGPIAKPGKLVQVYYEGRLKSNNKLFDSSNKGAGFKFRIGKQEVIKGWDVGLNGMKVGGKRRIICPPHMAYGAQGSPPVIPPNSTLVFEIELKNVKN